MTKQAIKIIILFLLIIGLLIGGWYIYMKLQYNKQSYDTDIYSLVSPEVIQVINLNKEYNLKDIVSYDSSILPLTNIMEEKRIYPLVFIKYPDNEKVLIAKTTHESQSAIEDYINNHFTATYPPRIIQYKETKITICPADSSNYIIYCLHKGLFVVSKSYRAITKTIDTDPENTFFTTVGSDSIINKQLKQSPVSIFYKEYKKDIAAFDYRTDKDSIIFKGYISDHTNIDSTIYQTLLLPILKNIPDNICIDEYTVSEVNKPATVKIKLNKIY